MESKCIEEYTLHLAAIVEFCDDAIISKSLDGIIKSWNKGGEKMFGYTAEQAVGKHISLIIPEKYMYEEKMILEKIHNNEIVDHYETVRKNINGEQIYVSLTASPLKNSVGNITGVSSIVRDISARKKSDAALIQAYKKLIFQNNQQEKRAEELFIANEELKKSEDALKKSNELFLKLFDYNPAAIGISDNPEGKLTKVNDAFLKLFGFSSKEEVLGKSTVELNLVSVDQRKAIKLSQEDLMVKHFEVNARNKNGKSLCISLSVMQLEIDNAPCIISVSIDITERKQAEDQLKTINAELAVQNTEKQKRAEELMNANLELLKTTAELIESKNQLSRTLESVSFFASIAANIQDPVISTDDNFIFTSWNAAAEKLFEWKSAEVIGRTAPEILNGIYPYQTREQIHVSFKEKGFWQGEVIYHTKSGKPLNVLSTASHLKDAKGNVTGALSLLRDITERKKTEKKIRESEQMFSSLFYKSPIIKAIAEGSTGKYIEVNDAFATFVGHTKEYTIGKTPHELNLIIRPEEREQLIENIRINGFARDVEIQVDTTDGRTRWVSASIDKIDLNGKDCLLTAAIEITTRKEAEESLSRLNNQLEQRVKERTEELDISEKRFRALIENSDDIIAMLDKDMHSFYRSPSAEHLTGFTFKDKEDGRAIEEVHADDVGKIKKCVAKMITKPGRAVPVTFRLKHKNGHYIWLEGTFTNLIQDVNVRAIVANMREVTERIAAEEKIRDSELFYRSLIEQSTDAIYIADAAMKYIDVNYSGCQMFGYSKEEFLHLCASDLLPDKDLETGLLKIAELKSGKTLRYERSFLRKDGGVVEVESNEKMLDDGRFIMYARDISERKKAETQIIALNEGLEQKIIERTSQLEVANNELESFSYSVSHDLRAPLRAVNGYAKILEEDYNNLLDDEGKRLLTIVQVNAQKMGVLIDDLLAFSRLGKKEVKKSMINMTALAEHALAELNLSLNGKTIVKINTLDPVMADNSLMSQVWINLLSNAMKYSANNEKPFIEVKSENADGKIIYSIADNGVGFDMQYAHKLFGVFQRLHTTEDFEGTGVGLALVHRIITKQGGRIWANAEIAKGATFYFSLP